MSEELKLEDAEIAPAPWHITPVAFSDPIITDANHRPVHYTREVLERIVEAVNRVDKLGKAEVLERKVESEESRANQHFHESQEAKKLLAELLYYTLEDYDEDIASTAFVGCVKDSCTTLGISYSPHGRDMAVPVQEYLNDSYAKPKKFDEAAFDAAISMPNGWDMVADPVAEVRRMRGDEQEGNAAAMRAALGEIVLLTVRAGMSLRSDVACGIIASKARAALAAPARNCDVIPPDEWMVHFKKYCRKYSYCSNCPIHAKWDFSNDKNASCLALWAQMPYEEGDGNA